MSILSVNRAFSQITGFVAEEAIGKTPAMLSPVATTPGSTASLWQRIRSEGNWQGEICNAGRAGKSIRK